MKDKDIMKEFYDQLSEMNKNETKSFSEHIEGVKNQISNFNIEERM